MSSRSRSCAGAAFLAVLISIPAMAQAQTSVAERSLMNRAGTGHSSRVGEHQHAVPSRGSGDQGQASRALLGTVGAVPLTAWPTAEADSRFPTPEWALLGQIAGPKNRREN